MTQRYTPGDSSTESSGYLQVITPNDGADLAFTTKAVYVGGAGALSVIDAKGNTVLLSGIPAGTCLRIAVNRIRLTGTTATLIVAMF
jgi:DNA-binding beta-propeller fold protein YncE